MNKMLSFVLLFSSVHSAVGLKYADTALNCSIWIQRDVKKPRLDKPMKR